MKKWISRFLGSIGFLGYIPPAPGTIGSALGCALAWLLLVRSPVAVNVYLLICFVTAIFGFLLARNCQTHFGKPDPGAFILDELAGQLLVFIAVPISWRSLLLGFLYFRFLDIIKPFPVRESEQVEGGTGVMLDDLVAGLYGCGLLHTTLVLYHATMAFLTR